MFLLLCILVCFQSWQNRTTLEKILPLCIVVFAFFALRRLVADHELSDISVYLLRVQLR